MTERAELIVKTETEAQIIEKRVRLEGSEADQGRAEIEADCLWKLNIAGRLLCVFVRARLLSLKKPSRDVWRLIE